MDHSPATVTLPGSGTPTIPSEYPPIEPSMASLPMQPGPSAAQRRNPKTARIDILPDTLSKVYSSKKINFNTGATPALWIPSFPVHIRQELAYFLIFLLLLQNVVKT
jgi:hypothetical protein